MLRIGIVGGGVVGSTIAYELSAINKDLNITLYEANQTIEGATWAALGVLVGISSQKKGGRAWQLRQESILRYPSLLNELESITGSPIPHNCQGLVHLCFTKEALAKWQDLKKYRENWTLEIWNVPELSQRCPEIVNKDIVGAIYSPSDWQINPIELTQALWKALIINGVNLRLGQKVSQVIMSQDAQSCRGVMVNNEFEALDYIVIAAGIASPKLTNKVQIEPVIGQALHLRLPEDKHKDFHPVITGKDVHVIPQSLGEYWVGATVEFGQSDPQALQSVLDCAISFYPTLSQAAIVDSWLGERPRPVEMSAPVIEQAATNIILATGHYRNGVLLAPATALKVKNMIFK